MKNVFGIFSSIENCRQIPQSNGKLNWSKNIKKKYWHSIINICIALAGVSIAHLALGNVFMMPAPGNDIVGQVYAVKIKANDSLNTIRQRYEVSYHELIEANPQTDFYKLKIGQTIIVPEQYVLPQYRHGIVINIAELRLYYFSADGQFVFTYPVALGRANWRTPTIVTKVVRKQYQPTWYVPESIQEYMYKKHAKILADSIPPGPDNPLGDYALYFARSGYLIHGTNAPDSVGTFASSGCIRLAPDHLKQLYQFVDTGTPVYIIHHENKAGWLNKILYLESHVPVQNSEIRSALNFKDALTALKEAMHSISTKINWQTVKVITENRTGIPVPVGVQT